MLTALSPEVVQEKISSSPVSYGRECTFVPVADGWGVKLYSDATPRNRGYSKQVVMHKHGLAPMPGEPCEMVIDGRTRYGYTTETVSLIVNNEDGRSYTGARHNRQDLTDQFYALSQEDKDKFNADHIDLMNRCDAVGIVDNDFHLGNVGYNKDGVMVILDCGDCFIPQGLL